MSQRVAWSEAIVDPLEPNALYGSDNVRDPAGVVNMTSGSPTLAFGQSFFHDRHHLFPAERFRQRILNAKPPGVAGIAEVARESYPDHTAWDESSKYHDPKSPESDPRWFMVDVRFVEKFPEPVPLPVLKETPGLEDMMVIRRGARLSVQPVTKGQFDIVVKMGRGK